MHERRYAERKETSRQLSSRVDKVQDNMPRIDSMCVTHVLTHKIQCVVLSQAAQYAFVQLSA